MKTTKQLDLTTYTCKGTGIESTQLVDSLFNCLNGISGLKETINNRLNGDLDSFKLEAGELGFQLTMLDDNRRAYNVLASTISQCTHERVGYQGKKLGLQTVKVKGIVTKVVCGIAKSRKSTQSKTLTKAMSATAVAITTGREYGDMMDLLVAFCEVGQITSEDLEVLATMVG